MLIKCRDDIKTELCLKQDKVEYLSSNLQDTLKTIKDNENMIENLRKELIDVKRSCSDSNIESEKYSTSNKELRDHIKQLEQMKLAQSRNIEDMTNKNSSLDDYKNELENEKTRILTKLQESESNLQKKSEELSECKNSLNKLQNDFSNKNDESKELKCKLNAINEEHGKLEHDYSTLKNKVSAIITCIFLK